MEGPKDSLICNTFHNVALPKLIVFLGRSALYQSFICLHFSALTMVVTFLYDSKIKKI